MVELLDHNLDNPLELENDVAQQVVDGLEDGCLLPSERTTAQVRFAGRRIIRWFANLLGDSQIRVSPTQDPGAYRAYVRGRQLYQEHSPAAIRSAIQSFAGRSTRTLNFALAFAALSDAYRASIDEKPGLQNEMIGISLRVCTESGQSRSPPSETHAALAGALQEQWDWEGSKAELSGSHWLDPKSPVAYRRYGGLILQSGQFDEALRYMQNGLELDALRLSQPFGLRHGPTDARRYDKAEEHLKWTLGSGT